MSEDINKIKHDLNNLLNAIIGSAEIIKFSIDDDNEKLKKYTGLILESATKATDITKSLK
ncbi:hypothetical protein EW093_04795 [Thiospirochaeta perfilievii]|uniref:histidine kinase n=1 Tax=Thiospirochaeta perfilievii TaxID=252967 RepID=A0A5C1Q9B0_9SPIO|nr:histidine kinase dimerization/phospho-acceptor domain-containing protein [Thiospirochaeta perfilievii]QEN04047.1 hypothetical protein EW093_04795 [Thiospirochaeta perfilievii]